MRPERLELEGFTAFRQRTVVSFADSDLFALSGPTGAGKSSLIDAIVFALYGTVPRLADRRRVGPIVSQGKVEARLGLDFTIGPTAYRAVRVVRTTPSGAASTKEARLERLHPDGTSELLAGDADEVSRQVTQLLGLSYEHFTTAVVLPQGEFARFLHHRPADRQALLKELLDLGLYDRLQQRATRHGTLAAERARYARSRLEELADATEEAAQGLHAARHAMGGLLDRCERTLPQLAELAARLGEATTESRQHRADADALRAVHKPDGIERLAAEHRAACGELDELEQRHSTLVNELGEREAHAASLTDEAACRQLIEVFEQQRRQTRLIEKGTAALAKAQQASDQAEMAHRQATDSLTVAASALDAARLAQGAAALAEHLHVGEDCPVCGQTIRQLAKPLGTDLAEAAAAHRNAEQAFNGAAAARQQAQVELVRVETKLDAEREQLDKLNRQLAETALDEAAARAQLQAASDAAAAVANARRTEAAHRKTIEAARQALRRSEQRQRDARRAFDEARDALGRLAPPPAARADLNEDWDGLVSWANARELEVLRHAAAAEQRREQTLDEQRHAAGELLDAARSAFEAIGLDSPSPGANEPGERAAAAVRDLALQTDARLAAAQTRLAEDRERAAAATGELAAAVAEEQVAGLLTQLLRANRFGAWILDEAVQQLVAGATGLLQRLSGGAYSLVLDGKDFAVIDHNNADAVRSARTLSGGETFLASLALALALADQVVTLAGPTAAPLESLFLDEGFGTLDPDTLDTVASAIEELGSAGRMVGIVTHVRELAERLPVRYEVTKSANGASVQRIAT